jgi:transcription-repair coupling factor (superfamily II helicase)
VLPEPQWDWETGASTAAITVGHLSQGFSLPADRYVFVAEEEIFGEKRHRRRARPRPVADYLTGLSQLTAGDYVVHIDHGIAVYHGLRHLNVAGTEGDYLHLEYANGDRLYLPVERINLVQKYTGADGRAPALDRLGGQSWEKTKRKTREAILAMARELLEIHAVRESTERPPLNDMDGDYEEFVAHFPFEETRGQRAAIEDVLADLRTDKPMDRLVCGDVGYGKTEVALRAAFLTVQNGKQVAVLVPTTILAQQHAETFARRFAEYPVRVELLNRFRTPQEVKAVVQGLAAGTVDIVVGTHRLLQRDIVFKNLGLIVIDEEHRFGVAHKEKIKKLRHLVDVLTLSATPIPRTLNMALMGLRDLSVIETPPVDRQAIRTYVSRYDDELVRSAILNELGRGGQVFFVHNRVETIEKMARQLRELVPEAAISVAHGQMPEGELEKVMLDFLHHRANVLLCSSIIESGLDIPTANTIIINRADQFGLAQLYQLRGRVGRAAVRAYAYLLIPGEHLLTGDARKRLEVLQELDDLGSGFRLAAHDLEIRGAGNLLGREQHGNVAAVGFELYAQMLEETVRELKGGEIQVQIEPEIQIGLPAYIPEAYIPDVNQRLVFYKKLANVQDRKDLEDLAYEMEDRFGPLPELVLSFIEVMDLRRVLREYLVTGVYKKAEKVTLHFHPDAPIKGERLVAFVQKSKGRSQLSPDLRLTLTLKPEEDVMPAIKMLLQELSESC